MPITANRDDQAAAPDFSTAVPVDHKVRLEYPEELEYLGRPEFPLQLDPLEPIWDTLHARLRDPEGLGLPGEGGRCSFSFRMPARIGFESILW